MPVKKPSEPLGASSRVQNQVMDASFGFVLVGQDNIKKGKLRVSKWADASIKG
jgi:predicted GNAT superfamily acetyltransferase